MYGVPEAAPPTTTPGNFWHHPLNPFYTSTQVPEVKMLPKYGYALVEEELPKRELDDEILSKENEILQQRLMTDDAVLKATTPKAKRKLNAVDDDGEHDLNSNYMDTNNNEMSSATLKQRKSALNVNDTELSPSSVCPGLATSAVTYKLD
jgi:hypothetical protein